MNMRLGELAAARQASRRWGKPTVVSAARRRLAATIRAGVPTETIAARFNVHRNTVVLWARMLDHEDRLQSMLDDGLEITTAAARLGVHANTVRRWALLLELRKQPRCARCGSLQRGCRGHRFVEGRRP